MANSAAEQIQVTEYKISGFNVVVTMPGGQQKVLKDGLADLLLGNIVLLDKNGAPISKEDIIDHVSVKQNALDSAFLGDFIKNKTNKQEDESGEEQDKGRSANEEMLQSIIKKLDAQLNEYKKNTSNASSEIDKLAGENQANLQTISQYLQELNRAKAEVEVLKLETTEKAVELQSIKEQLPYQKLAETFKSRQMSDSADDISGTRAYSTTQPVAVSKTTPSSSASALEAEKDDRPTLKNNEVAIDEAKLKELEESLKAAAEEKDKIEGELLGAKEKFDSELAGEKEKLEEAKDKLDKIEEEKKLAEADRDKALEDKADTDKFNNDIKETLTELGKSHFISPDFKITAILDPASDQGNSIESSKTDNITNVVTPTFTGTATIGTTVTLLISSNDTDSVAAQANIVVDDTGNWSYTVPMDLQLKPGTYQFSATSNKQLDITVDGSVKSVTESSVPITGIFVIDTTPPAVEMLSITGSQLNDDGSWLSGTLAPTYSGTTKPNSVVTLEIMPKASGTAGVADTASSGSLTFPDGANSATSSTSGLWSIKVPDDLITSPGDYHYRITVTDNAGNSGNAEADITIDNEILISTLLLNEDSDSGTKGDWQTNVTTPVFEGVTTKNGKPVANVTIKITIDGNSYEGRSNDTGNWSVKATTPVSTVGNQVVSLMATDSLGKTYSENHVINIDNRLPNVDASLTSDSDTGAKHDDGITNNPAPVLHGITSANSEVTITVYYNPTGRGYDSIDEHSYKHTKTITTSTGSWSYNVPMTDILAEIKNKYPETADIKYQHGKAGHDTDGVYQYSVTVRDNLGNENTTDVSNLNSWTIDTVSPGITVSVNGDQLATGIPESIPDPNYAVKINTPTITIASEPNSKVTITYPGADGRDGSSAITGMTGADGFFTKKLDAAIATYLESAPASGSMVKITVEDQAGNSTTQDFHFKYIPSSDLRIPITAHLDQADDSGISNTDGITNIVRPHIMGTTVAGATVTLSISSNGLAPFELTTTADASGNWRLEVTSDLPDGVTVFTATASSGGITSSTAGSFQIDTAGPKLTDLALAGPTIGYVNDGWTSGSRVDWKLTSWEGNRIVLSTGDKLRQQGSATFTGGVSEKSTIVAYNYMIGGTTPRFINTAETWTERNDRGQPAIKLAVGFNYLQSNLTNAAKNALIEHHTLPKGWSWGDLNYSNPNSIYGLGWEGFDGRWSLDRNIIKVTDVAGNVTEYNVTVEYNSVAPRVTNIHLVGNAGDDGAYNADTSTNNGLGQTLYVNSLTGFSVSGSSSGAAAVYLVDVSDKTDAWLQDPANRYNAVKNPDAKKYTGTLNTDGTWSLPYIANVRPGDHKVIKVIPVLTNPTGRPQDNISYLKVNVLQQHYNSTVNISADTDTGNIGDRITSNKQPTLEGTITNYNPAVSATISLDGGEAAPLTIDNSGNWSYSIPSALSDSVHRYTVAIKDKYGNGENHSDRFEVTGSFTVTTGIYGSLDPSAANDSGVTGDDITNVKSPVLIGKVDAGTTAKVIYTDLSGSEHEISGISTQADGNWTAKIAETLTDGVYTFSVIALDNLGKEVARKDGLSFTIDTTPPALTTEVASEYISDQAADRKANIFNHDPVLKGRVTTTDTSGAVHPEINRPVTITIAAGSKNYVYQGSTNSLGEYSITLNSSSIVDKTLPDLPDGTYTYSVRAEDVAGNSTKSVVTGTFSLDTTPPETLKFGISKASLHDTDGMSIYTKVFNNSTLHGKVDAGDRISIEFNGIGTTTPNSTAVVADAAGFTGYVVDAKNITVDRDGNWSATLAGLKSITVNRYTEVFDTAGNSMGYRLAGSTVNPDGAYYTVKVVAIDAAGNTKTSSFNYELGKLPPTTDVTILTPDGDPLAYNITHIQQPIFSGKTRSGASVTLNLSSTETYNPKAVASDLVAKTQKFTVKAGDDGKWSIPIEESNKLEAGFYYYSFSITDENGLSRTVGHSAMGGDDATTRYSLTIDTTPTGVTAKLDPTKDSATVGDFITNIKDQKITGTSGKNTSNISVYISNQPFSKTNTGTALDPAKIKDAKTHGTFVARESENDWYADLENLADGTYYIRVESSNFVGRIDNTLLNVTIDTTAPELNNVGLAVDSDTGIIGDRITSQTTPVLAGTTKPLTKLMVHVQNGTDWIIVNTTAGKDGQWNATMPALSTGTHKYWIQATDTAGNSATRGSKDSPLDTDFFTIQNVYTGSDTAISSELGTDADTGIRDYITSNSMPTITGTAPVVNNSVDGKSSRVFLDIEVNGVSHTYSGFNNGRGAYSIKITDKLPDGYYSYKVYTTDAAGNKSTVYESPGNLTMRDASGVEKQYAFKVQSSTPYNDLGLTAGSYGGSTDGSTSTTFNVTTATLVGLQGKIQLGTGDKASDYSVSVSIHDLSNDGNPLTLTPAVTINSDGSWSSNQSSISSLGIHNYTVTINDRKTSSNTSYNNFFVVRSDRSDTVTSNDTVTEQHGKEPVFSGTAPTDTRSILLTVFNSANKQIGEVRTIPVNSSSGKWSYHWTTSDGELFDGQYTYTLKTVNNVNVTSSSFASGTLEVYTTPPTLNYVEQDTGVGQNSTVSMTPNLLFYGQVDLAKGKYSTTLPDDTVVVKFKDFEIKATVDPSTGKWQITDSEYQTQLTASGGNADENSAYTVTLKDRFGNTSSDTGDLAPNSEQNGSANRPLFMGESDPGATITVIVENTTTNVQSTVQTKANTDGHWEVTWSRDLDVGTYSYSLNIVTTDGNNYNTGNLGSVTISPVTTILMADRSLSADDLLSATGSAADSTVTPDITHSADDVTRALTDHSVVIPHEDLDKVA